MGAFSGLMAGLGKGLQQAGQMGLEYTFNSKLQGERLKAEEKRQMRITEIEQAGLDKRLGQTIAAENLRGERAFEQNKMQHSEILIRIQAQIEQAKASNDIAKMNALTAERNALTASLTGASQIAKDKSMMDYYKTVAGTRTEAVTQKGITSALNAASGRVKTFSTQLAKLQEKSLGTVTPEIQDLSQRLRDAETEVQFYQEKLVSGSGSGSGDHLTPGATNEHPDAKKARKDVQLATLVKEFVSDPKLLDPTSGEYKSFISSVSGKISADHIEEAKGLAIQQLSQKSKDDKPAPRRGRGILGSLFPE